MSFFGVKYDKDNKKIKTQIANKKSNKKEKEMKDKIFGVLQRVGRSFMLPIALLPVAGLFLGIGGSFTNETMLTSYNLMGVMGPGTIIYGILTVMMA